MNQRSDSCQPVLEKCTRPNHPQSAPGSSRRPRPHQPIFPKTMQEPRKYATLVFTIAIRARGPAATRHFATHEHRLPILPMSLSHADSTVALPSLPCRIRPLAALPPKPLFRTSQIVWDRPSAQPPTVRHSRRSAEMFARFRQPDRQTSASFRAISRQNTPANAREKRSFCATFGSVNHFQMLANKCRHLQHACLQR